MLTNINHRNTFGNNNNANRNSSFNLMDVGLMTTCAILGAFVCFPGKDIDHDTGETLSLAGLILSAWVFTGLCFLNHLHRDSIRRFDIEQQYGNTRSRAFQFLSN